MSLDPASLAASFAVSGVGFVLFMYGRKMGRFPQIVGGIVLMVFPYFVSDPWWTLGIGALLMALVWFGIRSGM